MGDSFRSVKKYLPKRKTGPATPGAAERRHGIFTSVEFEAGIPYIANGVA
jgi:hypothetical protein